jgi:hypothetical protein
MSTTKEYVIQAPIRGARQQGEAAFYAITFIGNSGAFNGYEPTAVVTCRVTERDWQGTDLRTREIELPIGAILQVAAEAFMARKIQYLEQMADPVAYFFGKAPR